MNIGLNDQQRKEVVDILNKLLADEHILYLKTRKYHWNVTGPQFHDYHELFESLYTALVTTIDEIAERARTLGGVAAGTLKEFSDLGRLKEQPGEIPKAQQMIANLVDDYEAIIRQLRADVETCDDKLKDAGTADFLTGIMEDHEKTAWMLRSLLEQG